MIQWVFIRWLNYFLGLHRFWPMPQRHSKHRADLLAQQQRVEENESVFYQYQINPSKPTLFLHCSCHHTIVFKATLPPKEMNKIGYCQYVTFACERVLADIWRMSLLIAYCRSLTLEGREVWLLIVTAMTRKVFSHILLIYCGTECHIDISNCPVALFPGLFWA